MVISYLLDWSRYDNRDIFTLWKIKMVFSLYSEFFIIGLGEILVYFIGVSIVNANNNILKLTCKNGIYFSILKTFKVTGAGGSSKRRLT